MTNPTIDSRRPDERDAGAILLLVLAVAIVLSLVVLALANFVAADLRYSQIIDSHAKTLTSAESGIDYAIDRLRLNQTLCATDAAASPISLNGADPAGTPLLRPVVASVPQPVNGTDTRITCERLDNDFADVAGWSVVITNYGEFPPDDQIQVDMNDYADVDGPVFLPDPTLTRTDNNSRVKIDGGDLWYTKASCGSTYSNSTLASAEHIDITPGSVRGGICTTRISGSLFSAPVIQDGLPTTIVPDTPDPVVDPPDGFVNGDDTVPGCRVFSPGRYDLRPDLSGAANVYFKAGDYHFNFNDEWSIVGDNVWAGYPDTGSIPGPCGAAASADFTAGLYGGRAGATFYIDGASRIWVGNGASLTIFPRVQGNHIVSLHALDTSMQVNDPCACYFSMLRTLDGSTGLTVHGLVWAPRGRINIDNTSSGVSQRLLGGVVVQTLWLLDLDHDSFEIRPATSTVDTRILLTSKSTSLSNGGSTTVEAVVAYRPHEADPDDRVAITSFRVVD